MSWSSSRQTSLRRWPRPSPSTGGFRFNREVGKIASVLNELQAMEEVSEVYSVAGPYSIVAKIEADSFDKLSKIVPEKIIG
ncbi:MAG: Lrp/AsnC ligand binding domain-containing protein [Candidatus Hadarchaeales archaeon]